jgi:hypothetical protein
MKNKKLINHKKGELLKNSHFSFTEPLLNAATINKPIERDSSALLHNRPHHIKAMETGMTVFLMKDPAVVKKQNFYDGVNSPKLERKTGIYS